MTATADPSGQLTDDQINAMIDRIAARVAREAVDEAFRKLGIDIRDPNSISDYHADRRWTRSAREGSNRLSLSVKTTVLGSLATAILYAIWSAIQSYPPSG